MRSVEGVLATTLALPSSLTWFDMLTTSGKEWRFRMNAALSSIWIPVFAGIQMGRVDDTLCIPRCARSDIGEVYPRPPRILTTASHSSYTNPGISRLALRALIHQV